MRDEGIERPDLLGYAAEKLSAAVQTLATNPYDMQARLWAAAGDLTMVPPAGLPTTLRQQYEALREDLTRNPEGEPKYGASFRRKHPKTLAKLAERICSLEAQVDYFRRTHEQ